MEKLDLAKTFKTYYSAKTVPAFIEVEPAGFLAIEGRGNPDGEDFAASIEALYSVAYAVKFMCKALERDFVVPKLEGLWWFDETKYENVTPAEAPKLVPRDAWRYKLLLRMPAFVTAEQVKQAITTVQEKKQLTKVANVHLFKMNEGKCVQMLHVGPFSTEPVTLAELMSFINANGLQKNGLHHEIYLSDFRKTPAEKLRTILREPVK